MFSIYKDLEVFKNEYLEGKTKSYSIIYRFINKDKEIYEKFVIKEKEYEDFINGKYILIKPAETFYDNDEYITYYKGNLLVTKGEFDDFNASFFYENREIYSIFYFHEYKDIIHRNIEEEIKNLKNKCVNNIYYYFDDNNVYIKFKNKIFKYDLDNFIELIIRNDDLIVSDISDDDINLINIFKINNN